ncbi:hypothetical protein BU23DRAFT_600390 [Bimuria novae-zelandiae CBS 107.79]|uniref:Uncharacterized protein n=1 Tax=Bimuria novae-zelandiae CBS 107.79 TaxID=1447943 RepID=A0A6A5V1Z7_9PLEO|nr:hypothetical protein BU23DRAFT_600390 [Bimuria novae-zelandiae CBS 107.79]
MADQSKPQKTYKEQAGEFYNRQYENWVPWIEDQYLKWFTKDNKMSYAAKQELDKTKVTGIEQVDNLQDGVNNLIGGQLGKGGLAQPIGDAFSKEGINRAERGGKDEQGRSLENQGPLGGYGQGAVDGVKGAGGSVAGGAQSAGGSVAGGAQSAGGSVVGGAKSAGGWVGGMFGGKGGQNEGKK